VKMYSMYPMNFSNNVNSKSNINAIYWQKGYEYLAGNSNLGLNFQWFDPRHRLLTPGWCKNTSKSPKSHPIYRFITLKSAFYE